MMISNLQIRPLLTYIRMVYECSAIPIIPKELLNCADVEELSQKDRKTIVYNAYSVGFPYQWLDRWIFVTKDSHPLLQRNKEDTKCEVVFVKDVSQFLPREVRVTETIKIGKKCRTNPDCFLVCNAAWIIQNYIEPLTEYDHQFLKAAVDEARPAVSIPGLRAYLDEVKDTLLLTNDKQQEASSRTSAGSRKAWIDAGISNASSPPPSPLAPTDVSQSQDADQSENSGGAHFKRHVRNTPYQEEQHYDAPAPAGIGAPQPSPMPPGISQNGHHPIVGEMVVIHGLKTWSHYNNQVGVIKAIDRQDQVRFCVQLATDEILRVDAANLRSIPYAT